MRKFLVAVIVFFLVLDVCLVLDEKCLFFEGSFITIIEDFKQKTFEKVTETVPVGLKKAPVPVEEKTELPVKILEPEQLEIFRKSYSDVFFDAEYDEEKNDWMIKITASVTPGKPHLKRIKLWWADGKLLPESELENKDKYWPLIYRYEKLKDPATMTEDEIEKIREFTSKENRRNGAGNSPFFFDWLYAAKSQVIIEDHISRTTFLGHKTRIHERVKPALKRVESKIWQLADSDNEVKAFVNGLKSADAYNWREIEGTGRKSFHTYGIAVDILPKRLNGKHIFWSWTKDKDPKNWMLTPINKRWNPPSSVIEAFEQEGFIWGGNWIIFDNMHFEYHPELLTK